MASRSCHPNEKLTFPTNSYPPLRKHSVPGRRRIRANSVRTESAPAQSCIAVASWWESLGMIGGVTGNWLGGRWPYKRPNHRSARPRGSGWIVGDSSIVQIAVNTDANGRMAGDAAEGAMRHFAIAGPALLLRRWRGVHAQLTRRGLQGSILSNAVSGAAATRRLS